MTRRFQLLAACVAAALAGASNRDAWAKEAKCAPASWKDAIAEFAKEDADRPPPKDGILFVGSSSIRLWDLPKSFPELPAINRGFGGSQVCDSEHFADELVIKHAPRVVVFYAGDNDIAAGKPAAQVHEDFRRFTAKVVKALPKTRIVFISIKPSIARWKLAEAMREANGLIAADAQKDKQLEFVDVWPAMLGADGQPRKEIFREDGLHMNDAGYAEWTKLVSPHLGEKANDDTTDADEKN